MTLDRRKVMKLGTAATLGSMLPAIATAENADPAFEAHFDDVLTRLRAQLESLGMNESAALPLATGDTGRNGGLRHDFDQAALPQGHFVVQPLARVGDVVERGRADILPLFHEIGCHPPGSLGAGAQLRMMVRILTDGFGLDPARLAFVSVPESEALRPALDELGLPYAEKVLLRDAQEAFETRDASGYFFPDPAGEAFFVTMGIYYRLSEVGDAAPAAYPPLPDWTEIGEIVIAGDTAPLGFSFGGERLTLAITGQYPTWDQRLGQLFAAAEAEGGAPPGITLFR